MKQLVLFIQGAGEGAYKIDKLLADALQNQIGADYKVRYPQMPDEDDAPYEIWSERIDKEIAAASQQIILVGHSVGASHLAKCLTEIEPRRPVAGVYLLSTPFWGGDGWRYEGYEKLQLPRDAAKKFPKDAPVFLYHSRDDEIVPFTHLSLYAKLLPHATLRELDKGGHQLNGNLAVVAKDITNVQRLENRNA